MSSFIQLHTTLAATIPQVLPLPAPQLDGVAVHCCVIIVCQNAIGN